MVLILHLIFLAATKVTDEVVKVPAVNLDVCEISSPTRGSGQRSCSHASSTASSPSSADDKTEKLIAKIAATNPNMSPAFRIIADSKFCLKVCHLLLQHIAHDAVHPYILLCNTYQ